jgi:hypothetical protein
MPGATSMAFTPVPAYDGRNCGPWEVKGTVSGQPGTMAVPAGSPDFGDAGLTVNGQSVRGGGGGYNSGSGTMRSKAWYPSLYWQRQLAQSTLTVEGQGPAVWSDNQMPVPAASPLGRAAVLARPPSFLGQAQVRQPAGSKGPAWPDWLPRFRYGS